MSDLLISITNIASHGLAVICTSMNGVDSVIKHDIYCRKFIYILNHTKKIIQRKSYKENPFLFYKLLGECNTILSAYTLYRHLG